MKNKIILNCSYLESDCSKKLDDRPYLRSKGKTGGAEILEGRVQNGS